jgi:hypothetical protein
MMFFVLALIMRLHLEWAPLEFGLAIGLCSVGIGLYLHRLAREIERDQSKRLNRL